jgi:carbon monoxide dehydrogenase subunit G
LPQREAKFTVNAPPEQLWKFIRNFESLCTCIPGIERINVLDDRTADVTVKEKVGVVPLIVTLRAEIDLEEPPRRLHATAKGEHVTMAIDVALQATGAGTELVSLFDVKGEGPLKPIVDRLFEKRATERTVQFADCLQKRFGGAPLPSARHAAARWLDRLWRRLLALFSRP